MTHWFFLIAVVYKLTTWRTNVLQVFDLTIYWYRKIEWQIGTNLKS